MVHFSFATDPLPILLFWLNFGAWVVIWIGLVLRDRGSNVDVHTPSDQGSRTVIGISLWSGVLLAFLMAWAVPAAHIPGRGWPLLLRRPGADVGRYCLARLGGTARSDLSSAPWWSFRTNISSLSQAPIGCSATRPTPGPC